MPRLHKILEIKVGSEVLAITVYELTVNQIISMVNDEAVSGDKKGEPEGVLKFIERNLGKCTSLTIEQARELPPSDLKLVYDAFREVNATFFEVAREAGLINLLNELKAVLAVSFSNLLVGSLKRAMDREFSNMDTPTSSMQ
jgi:hypothetical protein